MSTEPNVKSFSATDAKGKPVRFTVSTDIIDYMASARTFGREDMANVDAHGRFQQRLIAIPDLKTNVVAPMVLTIGNQNQLYLVRKSENTAGESWKRIDLGGSFKKAGAPQVRALGAAWTDDDRIAVAVAVDDGPASPSRVFVAYNLSSANTDWENIPWIDCGLRDTIRVHGIRVLAEDDGSWTVVLEGDTGRVKMLYLLKSKGIQSFDRALVFNTAVDYQEILDFDVAIDPFVGSGIAVLGTSGNKRVLSFRPFPKYDGQGNPTSTPVVVPLPCPEGANVLRSGVTRNGGTDVYIGGQGVHLLTANEFENQDDAKFIPVASAEAAPNVQRLEVADAADGSVAVWARKQNGDLVVVQRPAGAGVAWGTPLRLRSDVQEIAPVHGDRRVTTSLLLVYTNGQAAFLFRDAASGTWRESPLLVANPTEVAKATCYGTTLRILDDGAVPRVNVAVKVTASVLTNVTLNRNNVVIGPDIEISTTTDGNGGVSIYDRVRSLTPAVYRFAIDGIQGSIDVNPAGGIYERFTSATAEELRKATVDGGKTPLLPKEFQAGGSRSQEVDGMVGALNQAAMLASRTTNVTVTGAMQVPGGAAFSSRLRLDAVPAGYGWGIQADAKGVRPATAAVMDELARAGQDVAGFFADLGDSLADLFEGVRSRIQEGWTFLVRKAEKAFEFICSVGNKIKRFVLNTLEQIGSFFTWLWQEIETGLEKLWEFLKFLFNWDDILVARDVMVKATDEALKYAKSSLGTMKEQSTKGFDYAIDEINKWRVEIGVPPAHLPPPQPGKSFAAELKNAPPQAEATTDQATGNSAVGWVFERLNGMFDEIIHLDGPNPVAIGVDAAKSFLTGMAGDQFDNLMRTWDQIQADIQKIFSSGMPEAKDLSFETIKNLVVAVGSDVVVGLLNALRSLVARAIDLLGSMIDVMHACLFMKISFPFIEKLVELVSPGAKVDTSFRLVDAIMLLVSIPATITYKLIFKEAPFKRGAAVNLPFGRVTVQGDFLEDLKGFKPYAGIAAAFAKTIIGGYSAVKGMAGEFGSSKLGIVLGTAFAGVGFVSEFFGMREKEGDVVKVLETTGVAAVGIAAAVSVAVLVPKWSNPLGVGFPIPHRIEALMEVLETTVQIVVGTVAFGFIVDNLGKSSRPHDKHRYLPETFLWISRLMDQASNVLVSSAVLLPVAAAPAKAVLLFCGTLGKGFALSFKITEVVVSTKWFLEMPA